MQLGQLQSDLPRFTEKGAQIIAISVEGPERVESASASLALGYPLLSDADHKVSETYGVYNLLGDGLATPSVFIVDRQGRIAWSHIGKDANDVVSNEQILAHLL